jgi:ATP-binding protein involved in chromosome partitioning
MAITKETVLQALSRVHAPDGPENIVTRGLVSEILVSANGDVIFALTADPARAAHMEPLRKAAEAAVKAIPGAGKVTVALTAERAGGHSHSHAPAAPKRTAGPRAIGVPGVKHIIAVASGKGGVGKSTVAVNLALGFVKLGLKVGILDADIYGPSMPKLLGINRRPELAAPNTKTLKPLERHGLKAMSMGFMVDEDTPMVWRGPMVMGALTQMLREVAWGDLDILVVDMPPGTGDVQLTISQQTPLAGAVVVSTPQDLALADARKGLAMFRKVEVPIFGIIENMSYFICDKCNERHEIFGHGGAKAEAKRLGVPFLGEIPLEAALRKHSDEGEPVVVSAPNSSSAKAFSAIAAQVWAEIEAGAGAPAAPRIVIED